MCHIFVWVEPIFVNHRILNGHIKHWSHTSIKTVYTPHEHDIFYGILVYDQRSCTLDLCIKFIIISTIIYILHINISLCVLYHNDSFMMFSLSLFAVGHMLTTSRCHVRFATLRRLRMSNHTSSGGGDGGLLLCFSMFDHICVFCMISCLHRAQTSATSDYPFRYIYFTFIQITYMEFNYKTKKNRPPTTQKCSITKMTGYYKSDGKY